MIHLTYYPYCAFVQLPHFPLQKALRSQYRPQQFIFILSLIISGYKGTVISRTVQYPKVGQEPTPILSDNCCPSSAKNVIFVRLTYKNADNSIIIIIFAAD